MAEVIDLVAYLRRRKLVAFLTEGVTIDLDEQMLEEFQYHLECFLTERHVDVTLLNDGQHNLEIQHLNQTFMTFHFLDKGFYVTLPYEADLTDPELIGRIGVVALSALGFWEAFEKEIPYIQQSFL